MSRIALKKALGQHHLRDASRCRQLLDFLEPSGAGVVEVGPGGGVLTRALLDRGARVWAWELDPEWAFELRRRLVDERLSTVVADALDLPFERLPPGCLVTGNLPFNVATPLIERLLLAAAGVPRAGFLVQREVADRLLGVPGDSEYGSLSVIVAACSRAVRLGDVPRADFRPQPRVDATFVGFELVEPPIPRPELPAFVRIVRAAFARRRKTLRNSLAAAWGREAADRALAALDLEPLTRAETLPVGAFVALHEHRRDALSVSTGFEGSGLKR